MSFYGEGVENVYEEQVRRRVHSRVRGAEVRLRNVRQQVHEGVQDKLEGLMGLTKGRN